MARLLRRPFELFNRCSECQAFIGLPVRGDLRKGQNEELVGTTRFELATSPTPRVRSTRLSHVPTCYDCRSRLSGQQQGSSSLHEVGLEVFHAPD
jgi:hypothetical protein